MIYPALAILLRTYSISSSESSSVCFPSSTNCFCKDLYALSMSWPLAESTPRYVWNCPLERRRVMLSDTKNTATLDAGTFSPRTMLTILFRCFSSRVRIKPFSVVSDTVAYLPMISKAMDLTLFTSYGSKSPKNKSIGIPVLLSSISKILHVYFYVLVFFYVFFFLYLFCGVAVRNFLHNEVPSLKILRHLRHIEGVFYKVLMYVYEKFIKKGSHVSQCVASKILRIQENTK